MRHAPVMTCSICGAKQKTGLALKENSGWDWFLQVRLCPECATTDAGRDEIKKEKFRVMRTTRRLTR